MKSKFLTTVLVAILTVTNLIAKGNKVISKCDATNSLKSYGMRVVDSQTNETIPYANVTIKTKSGQVTYIKADINGFVSLATLNTSNFTVNVNSIGFDAANNVKVNVNTSTKNVVINLTPICLSISSYDELGMR